MQVVAHMDWFHLMALHR